MARRLVTLALGTTVPPERAGTLAVSVPQTMLCEDEALEIIQYHGLTLNL